MIFIFKVSTHSRLKAAGQSYTVGEDRIVVSTHSRLKAAGCYQLGPDNVEYGFNTQPPEGGWLRMTSASSSFRRVSTHSRLKAAGGGFVEPVLAVKVSTHSRLKAAG